MHQGRSLSTTTTAGPHRSWDFPLGEVLHGSGVIAGDGTIYAATASALHAISPAGIERWKVTIQLPKEEAPSPAIGPDGTVYVRNGLGLSAFDPGGAPLWTVAFPDGPLSSPTLAADGTIYVSEHGGGLNALAKGGSVQATIGGGMEGRFSTPTITPDGGLAFIAVDTFGSEIWGFSAKGAPSFDTKQIGAVYGFQAYPVSGGAGMTYVPTDSALVAIDASGAVAWSYPNASDNAGPAIAADGTIYPSKGSPVMALKPDGTLLWSYDGGVGASSHSVAVAADGTIYAAGDRFYRVSPAGALVSVVDVGSPITSRIAIDEDGTALFGAKDGVLYAR